MSDEAALLQAIIAHPNEDTPRMAFADWLEEHGNADRAHFIRSQCRFAAASTSQPDYPDIFDEFFYSRARALWWKRANPPQLPKGFNAPDEVDPDADTYRRGFPYRVRGDWDGEFGPPDEAEIDAVCEALEEVVSTTTIRGLDLPDVTADQLARILAAPGAEALTGLTVGPSWDTGDNLAPVLASAKSIRGLTDLTLHFQLSASGARALAGAKFDRLESLDLPGMECSAKATTELTSTRWFRRLKYVSALSVGRTAQPALLAAFATMPKLDKLILDLDLDTGLNALGATDGFPELGFLTLAGASGHRGCEALARGSFPKLRALAMGGVRNGEFRTLLAAPWFAHLTMIDFSECRLNDKSVLALARSPAAGNLRGLQLGDNPIGAPSLPVLGDGATFSRLTRLDLDSSEAVNVPATEVRKFVAKLNLPRLVALYLDGWPLNTAGAEALAANPATADLISLSVCRCGLTDRGFNALARSSHLHRLVNLFATNNRIKKPSVMLKRDSLPALRELWLGGNRIAARSTKRLQGTRDWVVESSDE